MGTAFAIQVLILWRNILGHQENYMLIPERLVESCLRVAFLYQLGLKSIWGFTNMLPRFENTITLDEGNTPLLESTRLFKDMNVYFKDED
jgi:hypothetical protein